MQVFKAFFKILNKNKTTLIVYMVVYLALAFILSFNGNSCKRTLKCSFGSLNVNSRFCAA